MLKIISETRLSFCTRPPPPPSIFPLVPQKKFFFALGDQVENLYYFFIFKGPARVLIISDLNHDQTKHPTENFISQNLLKIH